MRAILCAWGILARQPQEGVGVRTSLPTGIYVRADVLRWARVSLNMPVDVAAARLKLSEESLLGWERDGAELRLTEIEGLARVYRRPSAVFFLECAPAEPALPNDHRTVPSQSKHQLGPKSILAIRFAQRVQVEADELAQLVGSNLRTTVPRLSVDIDLNSAARRLRAALSVSVSTQLGWRDEYRALRGWVAAVEGLGVIVLRQSMPVDETRGFALSGVPPVIVLNASDGVAPRIFSLAHELVHVALGTGSICDTRLGPYDQHSQTIETFCNGVAGALLVPADSLVTHPLVAEVGSGEWDEPRLRRIANAYGVSQEVVLRRLLAEDLTTPDFYRYMRSEWKQRPLPSRGPGGGADPVGDCIREHGRIFTQLVSEATRRGVLSIGEAADTLDIQARHLRTVFEQVT